MTRLNEGLAWAKRVKDERGGALIELAMCLPLLCILGFAIVEFSEIILACQVMNGMTRQGSDLASRAWPLSDNGSQPGVLTALVTQGAKDPWFLIFFARPSTPSCPNFKGSLFP